MYDQLIDARTGIVRRLRAREIPAQFPVSFALTHADLADTTGFCSWPADASGAGYAFADPTSMMAAAIGEAVERYCGNLVPPDLPVASYDELAADGVAAVDPATICLYSAQQYAGDGFPAAPLRSDRPLHWARGRDVHTGRPVLVPACLVWVSWFASPSVRREPLTNPVIQAGLAAGPSAGFAQAAALREVVERDALTLGWYGRRGLREVAPPRWLADFARGPRGALRTRFLHFPCDFGTSVLGALVYDETTGYLTLGAGVHDDPVDAALKAFAEALQLQLFVAEYDDPGGAYAAVAGRPGSPLKTWRADSRYADSYRDDLRDVVDYGCHLQLHLDPAVQSRFLRELDATILAELALADCASQETGALTDRISARGRRVIAVDVTTPDVAAAGLHVTRVVVPGLYSNSPIGLPFLGGQRLHASSAVAAPTVPLPH